MVNITVSINIGKLSVNIGKALVNDGGGLRTAPPVHRAIFELRM